MKKGKITCMFCKKKPGKFECDCGCIVCKDHSTLKEMQTEGQIYKVCFNCEKIVKKVEHKAPIEAIKSNICFLFLLAKSIKAFSLVYFLLI